MTGIVKIGSLLHYNIKGWQCDTVQLSVPLYTKIDVSEEREGISKELLGFSQVNIEYACCRGSWGYTAHKWQLKWESEYSQSNFQIYSNLISTWDYIASKGPVLKGVRF